MTLFREKIKSNFVTSATPTEAQFAELIDSGFDLHQFTYRANYPYEEGNVVLSFVVSAWGMYRRSSYDPGVIGHSVGELQYWTKVLGDINVFNVPIINPTLPPIKAPFSVFNQNKGYISSNDPILNNNDVVPVTIYPNTTLYFEDRSYNNPGKNEYLWSIKSMPSETIVAEYKTRDLAYTFGIEGNYNVELSVKEYGVETALSSTFNVIVLQAQIGDIDITIIANKSQYVAIDEVITYSISVTNTGNVLLQNIVISFNLGIQQITIPSLAIQTTSSIYNKTYNITASDMLLEYVTCIATVNATTSVGDSVSDSKSISIGNNQTIIAINSFDVMPLKGYAGETLTYIFEAEFSDIPNPVNIEYIELRATVNGITSAIPNGRFDTEGLINGVLQGTSSFLVTLDYTTNTQLTDIWFSLIYKEYFKTEIPSVLVRYNRVKAIDILSLNAIDQTDPFEFLVILNKTLSEMSSNDYTCWEARNDSEYTLLTEEQLTWSSSGIGNRTITFNTNLGNMTNDDIVKFKIIEILQPDANDASKYAESEFTYSIIPQVYWGVLDETRMVELGYFISRTVGGVISPIPEGLIATANLTIDDVLSDILTEEYITTLNSKTEIIQIDNYISATVPELLFYNRFNNGELGFIWIAFPDTFLDYDYYTQYEVTNWTAMTQYYLKGELTINGVGYRLYIKRGVYPSGNLDDLAYNPNPTNIKFKKN